MSFVEIKPYMPRRGWQGCAISVTPAGNNLKLRVHIKRELLESTGMNIGDRLNCLIGEDDDKGKIMIMLGDSFSLSKNGKADARIDLPLLDGIPTETCSVTPTTHEIVDGGLVVSIPKLEPKKKVPSASRPRK